MESLSKADTNTLDLRIAIRTNHGLGFGNYQFDWPGLKA